MTRWLLPLALVPLGPALCQAQTAAVQVSSYLFQENLHPQRAGSDPLTAVDPSGQNRFTTDVVFGAPRVVYDIQGAAAPKDAQGGFTYRAKDKIAGDNFSIEFVFSIRDGSGWRRLLDFRNRAYSEGLYLDPSGWLNYYSGLSASGNDNALAANAYYHVVLVKRPRELYLYLNGRLVASVTDRGDQLGEIRAAENPDRLIHFLLDDNTSEWAPARIALFRVYSGNLTAAEVRELATSPFTTTVGLPKPAFQTSGVVNSATNLAGVPAGGFFTVFGNDLADQAGDWSKAFVNHTAPKRLNDVRVLINDQEAAIAFTHPGQINAIAPDNLVEGPVTVVVENNGRRSAAIPSTYRRLNPGFFRFGPQDNRYLAATANDGSAYIAPPNLFGTNGVLNGLAIRPARPGEYVALYATGTGASSPSVPAGEIPPSRDGGYPLANAAELRLNTAGGAVTVIRPAYAGLSGFPGTSLIVFQVPDVANGDYQVVLTVGGQSSPVGVYLPISR